MAGDANALLAILGAVAVTAPFWISGIMKAWDFRGAVAEVAALNMPVPVLTAFGVIALQLLGSLCIVTGLFVWPAAIALICFTGLASFAAHDFWNHDGEERAGRFHAMLANTGLAGGLILAALLRS